ncbi:MAG: amidohydrolase [Bermanella sp.]
MSFFIKTALIFSLLLSVGCFSLQDLKSDLVLYKAKEIITFGDQQGDSVLVNGDVIIEVGDFTKLKRKHSQKALMINTQFEDSVMVPGFINQHDHPWLGALTLTSQIISIEDWGLPSGFFPKATTPSEYHQALIEKINMHKNKDSLLLSWGYHGLWHGPLTRKMLDEMSEEIPIAIWHRSVHEFIVNTKALALFGIDKNVINKLSVDQRNQTNLAEGHFWESGMLALSGKLFKHVLEPNQFMDGLYMLKHYWHSAGSTLVVEPGGLVNKNLSIMQNAVFSSNDNPFYMDYIVDGKTMALKHMSELLEKTAEIQTWGDGMSRYYPKQIKLFSDGAVFSQLMKMRDGYLDGHHGEWIMQPDLFKQAFSKYWDAGFQIHVHQNGDAGLDLILNTLDENIKRNPRHDHRTVIVHFSYSRLEQIKRIKELGAIVSVNPYYPVALAEKYSEVGVGPERSHEMVRLGDLVNQGVSFSLHSDMPMAPGKPLYLMGYAVNRMTENGQVIAPEQTITPEQALRAVTINAAYSIGLEKEIGSIEKGKQANITMLESNPLTVAPLAIKDIKVEATMHDGRVFMTSSGYPEVSLWQLINVYIKLAWFKLFD